MALQAWAKFTPCSGNDAPKDSKPCKSDLCKGQTDLTVEPSTSHPPSEWFKIVHWSFAGMAPVDAASATPAGSIGSMTMTVIKYWGRLSPLIFDALVNRTHFNLTIDIMERMGDDAKQFSRFELKGCQFSRVHHYVGSEKSSGAAVANVEMTDTTELEEFEVVFQSFDHTHGIKDAKTKGNINVTQMA